MKMDLKKLGRYLSALVFCNFYRILRIFPNNDPIMGFALPYAKRDKWWQAVLFAVVAMVSFDFIVGRVGIWTLGTAAAYGLIAGVFSFYFKRKKSVGLKTYAGSSIVGILIFDFLTGPVMSSFAFRIPFWVSFMGQIPFTAWHLASGFSLTMLLVPVVDPDIRAAVKTHLAKTVNGLAALFAGLYKL